MAYKKRKSPSLEKGRTRAASLKSIDPHLDLGGDLTLDNYTGALGVLEGKLNDYNTDLSELDGKLNEVCALEKQVNALSEQILAGVGTKYGFSSKQYEQAGGTPRPGYDLGNNPPPPQPVIPFKAAGFGSAGANGDLTFMGTFAGKPYYRAAGGWYFCWNPDGGMWICRDAEPGTGGLSNNRYADIGYAEDITAVQWTGAFNPGDMPCGTVTTV